jgi:nucleotide-binding universal stress UspA family protein
MAEIVVGVDGSEASATALRWAAQESSWRGEPLVAVLAWGLLNQHHPDPDAEFDPEYDEQDAREALASYVADALGEDAPVELRTVCDLPGRGLVEAAAGSSMLVVGARGLGGFKGLLLGSVSHHCLHHATCPVAVIHLEGNHRQARERPSVVVGVDGSAISEGALRWAADEAKRRGADLVVVHAWQLPFTGPYPIVGPVTDVSRYEKDAQQILDRAAAAVPASDVTSKVLLLGSPSSAILEAGEFADLIVVGSRGVGGLERVLLGSTSTQVIHHAPCPVVVVPPSGTGS